jgi:hypothetical protein
MSYAQHVPERQDDMCPYGPNKKKKPKLPKACEKFLLIMEKSRCTYWPLPKSEYGPPMFRLIAKLVL